MTATVERAAPSPAGELWRSARVPLALVAVVVAATVLAPEKVPAGVVLQGVILGGGTALLAVGLVLTYRSHRIVNFAFGAMGGLAAAVAAALYQGELGVPWFAAVAVAVVLGVVIGFFVELIVIRRFANASRLTLTMATIGLAQVLGGMELLVPIIFKGPPLIGSFETPLNAVQITVDPVVITGNDLLLLAIVPVVLGALTWFLLRTEAGIAVRGIADNTERARLLGIPVDRLSTLVWCISGVAAAVTVTLKSPGEGLVLDAAAGPQLLLPALAAAVVAKMTDLPRAVLAGVALGVLDQVTRWNVDKQSVTSVVFLVVILAALLVQKGVGGRSAEGDDVWSTAPGRRMPEALARLRQVRLTRRALGILGVAVLAGLPFVASASQLNRVSVALLLGILTISVVLLTGWSGSVSLGQAAIAGVGGVVVANLVGKAEVDVFVGLLAAAGVGALLAVLLGLPALRVAGLFLAVTTMAFAVAVDAFFLNPVNFPDQIPDSFARPVLWGIFDARDEQVLYLLCLGFLVVTAVAVTGLRRARTGRSWLAGRDNRRAAEAAGIGTVRSRLGAFVISGMIAGVAGGLYVQVLGGVGFHTFQPAMSLLVFSMAVIGGMASIAGAMLGVVLVQGIAYVVPQYQLIITGAGTLLVLLGVPQGLIQLVRDAEIAVHRRLAKARGLTLELAEAEDASTAAAGAGVGDETARVLGGAGGTEASRTWARWREGRASRAAAPRSFPEPGGRRTLSCHGVEASYGPMQVLFGVDLEVAPGELVALLGTNGAGKSTLLRSVTGLLPPDAGAIELDGAPLRGLHPEEVARRGVSLMPGGRGLFRSLTVGENLRLAAWLRHGEPGAVRTVREEALALMPRLADRLEVKAGELSGGEQQMLSLAMALAPRPEVLCIDELSLGLAPTVVADLVDHVKRVHAAGTTVVIVEQSVNVALLMAERAVFLEKGAVTFEGPTAELLERPDVLRSVFVGNAEAAQVTRTTARPAPGPGREPATTGGSGAASAVVQRDRGVALECVGVTKRYGGVTAVDDVHLHLAPGTIVGVIGHNGAGKTTLLDCISGFTPIDAGKVLLGGHDVSALPPYQRAIAGLGRSFQEARLYPSLTVRETVAVALDQHLANRDPLAAALWLPVARDSEAAAAERVEELLELLGLARYRSHLTAELSTGTRRIVELASILAQDPAVVLLDEPSAGVAQRETEALGPLLRQVQEHTGCSMLVIEHDMALMTGLCDELVAMELGRVITRGLPADVLAHERVIASYLGTDDAVIHRSGSGPAPSTSGPAPAASGDASGTAPSAF